MQRCCSPGFRAGYNRGYIWFSKHEELIPRFAAHTIGKSKFIHDDGGLIIVGAESPFSSVRKSISDQKVISRYCDGGNDFPIIIKIDAHNDHTLYTRKTSQGGIVHLFKRCNGYIGIVCTLNSLIVPGR